MTDRREFIRQASLITGAAMTGPQIFAINKSTTPSDTLRIALVGCGGRGTGAVAQALQADPNTELVAMADVFEEQITNSLEALMEVEGIGDRIKVKNSNKYLGFDAYQKATDQCDVVILATPPGFRPEHFEYAVEQGKHVFMEKPLSCDSPGTRRILDAGKKADEKNLKVVVGLQNRYDPGYQAMVEQIQA